jgi:hypothetical protein
LVVREPDALCNCVLRHLKLMSRTDSRQIAMLDVDRRRPNMPLKIYSPTDAPVDLRQRARNPEHNRLSPICRKALLAGLLPPGPMVVMNREEQLVGKPNLTDAEFGAGMWQSNEPVPRVWPASQLFKYS